MRCKCIKEYVPSMPVSSINMYEIHDELLYDAEGRKPGYIINKKIVLSKEIFDEHFVDISATRNEVLEELGI